MRQKTADLAAGVAAAALIFAAVPAVLVALTGPPDPARLAHVRLSSAATDLQVLAAVAWVAWIGCCGPLLASVVRRVRRRDVSTPTGARVPEWVASRIAAAVLALGSFAVMSTAGAASGGSAPATAPPAAPTTAATPATASGPDTRPAATSTGVAPVVATSPTAGTATPTPPGAGAGTPVPSSYTVADGDTLWSIAQRFYDDGSEWPTIAAANLGRIMDDGSRFMDPSLIRPGWVLTLPPVSPAVAPATPPVAPAAAAPATPEAAPAGLAATTSPRRPLIRTAGDEHGAGGGQGRSTGGGQGRSTGGARGRSTGGARGRSTGGEHKHGIARSATEARGKEHRPGGDPTGPMPLPELVALGTGAVLAAALARRARRARHRTALVRPEGGLSTGPSEPAAGAAADLVPFERTPALDWLEAANRHLAAAVETSGQADEVPPVRLLRVGSDGVEVRLAGPVTWAPSGWVPTDGPAWLLPATGDQEAVFRAGRDREPWLPALLPVGTNAEGTWLVPAEPGSCLSILGPRAEDLTAAMRMAADSWAWAEQLVVTDDYRTAEDRSATVDVWGDGLRRPRVVFFGDPAALTGGARERCAVVTTLAVAATDLTVTVDGTAASLHPLGIVVRPDLLDAEQQAAVAEVLGVGRPARQASAARSATVAPVTVRLPEDGHLPEDGNLAGDSRLAGTAAPGKTPLAALRPGPVEVRLLTAAPRLDGLAEELTPKRSRRAVELVAYLALHHPVPVTSDRLRTRVLGSADADAAAKTLFNTAGAARRALGRDQLGEPLLPPATKGSHYRISPVVTTDVGRASALVEAADKTVDREEAMALLREALSLVEDEPLAQALSGYAWWQAEGHEQRVAGTLVDAACRLAPLASEAGLYDLARWAVDRARLVEPYSEALCRVAMRAAADSGDADRLRREWQECLRRVDELDPGSRPSEATERLYVDLCRRMPALTD